MVVFCFPMSRFVLVMMLPKEGTEATVPPLAYMLFFGNDALNGLGQSRQTRLLFGLCKPARRDERLGEDGASTTC